MNQFEQLGISAHQLNPMAGVYQGGTVMICGGAGCVWKDIAKFLRRRYDISPPSLPPLLHTMSVNDITMHLPLPLHHAYANSCKELERWIQARRIELRRMDDEHGVKTRVHSGHPSTSDRMERWPWPLHGTSGLNAVYTALALGYSEIVLCGIPLDDSPHYWQAPWGKANFICEAPDIARNVPEKQQPYGSDLNDPGVYSQPVIQGPQFWLTSMSMFEDKVRSMSGRTRDLLGEPNYAN